MPATPPNSFRPRRPASLRTELLISFAVLAVAALTLGVASVLVLYELLDARYGAIYSSILIGADVTVLTVFAAFQVDRIVLRPLREAMDTAEAIAAGDLARRLGPGGTQEMANLAVSVNRMTDRLLEERAHVVRAEKMASIGRLAAGIAHEIGNPLGAINGYAHLLRTNRNATELQEAVAGLEREAARIDRIVRGLLDYARPTARSATDVDVPDVARTVVDLLRSQGALKRIDVQLDVATEPVIVVGDRHDLEQTLINLVLNAVDAMESGGSLSVVVRRMSRDSVRGTARRVSDPGTQRAHPPTARSMRWVESVDASEVAMLAITDSGPGIPDEDLEKIFEPFYTTKDPGKGTGLGLAIVARAVENFGGTIWASRAREGGAAFRILLPAKSVPTMVAAVGPVGVGDAPAPARTP